MSLASSEIQNLARRLVTSEAAHEAAHDNASDARGDVTVQVIEALRLRLVRLVGVDGFRSLLSRALTLAKSESPSLHTAHVRVDGSLDGFDEMEQSGEAVTGQAGGVLVAHLLQLLVTFIGEPLTLRLVRDTWPDASLNGEDLRSEDLRGEEKQ